MIQIEFYTRVSTDNPDDLRFRKESNRRMFICQRRGDFKSAQVVLYKNGDITLLAEAPDADRKISYLNEWITTLKFERKGNKSNEDETIPLKILSISR